MNNKCYMILGAALLSLTGVSCDSTVKSGYYRGSMQTSGNGRLIQDVGLVVKFDKPRHANVEIKDLNDQSLGNISVYWHKYLDKIDVTLSILNTPKIRLSRSNISNFVDPYCYAGKEAEIGVTLCIESEEITLKASDIKNANKSILSLVGQRAAQQVIPEPETPRVYTLSEALALVSRQSFDSMIEYQNVRIAQESARVAYFNLVPHFNYKLGLGISALLPLSFASYVADFVPFLIPTRWIRGFEASALSEAEQLTLDILRADLQFQMSSWAYVLDRDRMSLNYYNKNIQAWAPAQENIDALSRGSVGQLGDPLDELHFRTNIVLNGVQQERVRLENALRTNQASISHLMGFRNPFAVTSIQVDGSTEDVQRSKESAPAGRDPCLRDYSVEHCIQEEQCYVLDASFNELASASKLDSKKVQDNALQASLELRQLNLLIHNAKLQQQEFYFNWLDPDVPSNQSISVSLIPMFERAASVIERLRKMKEQMKSRISQDAANAVTSYNNALDSFSINREALSILNGKCAVILQDIVEANGIDTLRATGPGTQWALNTTYIYQMRMYQLLTEARVAKARIDRLYFKHYYESLTDSSKI